MGGELSDIVFGIREFCKFWIRTCYRSVCNHPLMVCMVFLGVFLYRSFPYVFSLLVYASPILVSTLILLGFLLSLGEPNSDPDQQTHDSVVSLKSRVSNLRDGNAIGDLGEKSFEESNSVGDGEEVNHVNGDGVSVEELGFTEEKAKREWDFDLGLEMHTALTKEGVVVGDQEDEIFEFQYSLIPQEEIEEEEEEEEFKYDKSQDEVEEEEVVEYDKSQLESVDSGRAVGHLEDIPSPHSVPQSKPEEEEEKKEEEEEEEKEEEVRKEEVGDDADDEASDIGFLPQGNQLVKNSIARRRSRVDLRMMAETSNEAATDSVSKPEGNQPTKSSMVRRRSRVDLKLLSTDNEEASDSADFPEEKQHFKTFIVTRRSWKDLRTMGHNDAFSDSGSKTEQNEHMKSSMARRRSRKDLKSMVSSNDASDYGKGYIARRRSRKDLRMMVRDNSASGSGSNPEKNQHLKSYIGRRGSRRDLKRMGEDNASDSGPKPEENQQLSKSSIGRRRSRKDLRMMSEKNLTDMESFGSSSHIAPISTIRTNPFDKDPDSYRDSTDLPPVPGSAPSMLIPKRSLFNFLYDSNDEKTDPTGDNFPQELATPSPRKSILRRNESFDMREKKDINIRPYFVVPQQMATEGRTSYPVYQRQSSELNESLVSSIPETEEDAKFFETELSQQEEMISGSTTDHESERVERERGSSDEEEEEADFVALGPAYKRAVEQLDSELIKLEKVQSPRVSESRRYTQESKDSTLAAAAEELGTSNSNELFHGIRQETDDRS